LAIISFDFLFFGLCRLFAGGVVIGMFEGGNNCNICRKEVEGKDRFFGLSLSGRTYTFCKKCFEDKKEDVQRMLHD